jgi:hypothetical protein
MTTRRDFVQGLGLALGGMPVATGTARAGPLLTDEPTVPGSGRAPTERIGSDIGSLFPFIRSQAVRGEFPLSFLRDEFRDPMTWKQRARRKLKELLHYDPPACDPRPEVDAKVDRDGYVRETVYFKTTPDILVPAYVLVPKGLKKRAPAIVVLHDHGGMYFWGREKVVEVDDEHAVLAEFKRGAYGARASPRNWPAAATSSSSSTCSTGASGACSWTTTRPTGANGRRRSDPRASPNSTAALGIRSSSSPGRFIRRASPGRE